MLISVCQIIRKLTHVTLKNLSHSSYYPKNKIVFNNGYLLFSYISVFKHLHDKGIEKKKFSVDKINRYWSLINVDELIEKADKLFENEKYLEVYELLNRLKYDGNVEIEWRICRVLFKLSTYSEFGKIVRNNMILEAYDLVTKSLNNNPHNSEVHKWMAIILHAKTGLESTVARLKASNTIKEHLLKSLELNPNDASILYMLGYWCYEMSKFTTIQKKIIEVFFNYCTLSSYEEAYQYFNKVEEMRPRFYLDNTFMLGMCCYHLEQFYRARYYLKIASEFPAKTTGQKEKIMRAKQLAQELKEYDVEFLGRVI